MKERKLLIGSIVLVCAALVTAYIVFVGEQERQRELKEISTSPMDRESFEIEDQSRGVRSVKLYFYRPGQLATNEEFFEIVQREIFDVEEIPLLAKQIINELTNGSENERLLQQAALEGEWFPTWQTVPRETVIRQFYLLDDGTAIIDLSRQGLSNLAGGITSELAFVYSITRSLRENLENIKRVQFIVEGKTQSTLAGHVSIAEPFR